MADGEVKIDTKLDTDGINEGLKDLKVKLNNLGVEIEKDTNKEKDFNKELNDTADATNKAGNEIDKTKKKHESFGDILKGVKEKINGTTIAGVAAVAAIKKTVDALNDCAAAYRVQQNAEEALQVAAKNNPYLDDESVYNLRNFASELQSLSEIGDEVSLQVMSQLAATGRNEEQIMSIMSAAADMAAVTGQDLASAAQQLNATLNGNAGLLGRQIGAINNLTQEELKNGKAIELVAKQYKGVAAATADVEVQISNAWGDLKENIGRGWQNVTQPVKQFFLDVLNNINEATAKTNALKDAKGNDTTGTATSADTKLLLEDAQNRLTQLQKINKNYVKETTETVKTLEELQAEWDAKYGKMNERMRRGIGAPARPTSTGTTNKKGRAYLDAAAKENQKEIARLEKEIERLTNQYTELKDAEDKAAEAAKAAAEAADAKAAAQKRDDDAITYINANTKALQEQIKALELKAAVEGKNVNAGEMYNAYLQSYIELITKSNGLVTENNQAAKNRLATLQEWAKKAADAATEEERLEAARKARTEAEKLLEGTKGTTGNTYIDEYVKRRDELNQLREDLNNNLIKFDDDEIKNAEKKNAALEELDRQYAQNKKNLWANITAEISGYTEQTADIAQKFGDLMLKNVQTETDLELAKLDEKYEKGEMSEEQYYEKQKAIKRKAAQEEYKIQMFQWTASILAATANIAEGVSKAIAQGGTAGLITGALVGAAGAVQIASIIASKPVPPQFYAGGIIGGANGATYGSDNTYIHARTGEMVLNAHQQRSLWDMINGQDSRQQAGLNLTVNNTQANRVDADVREQDGEVFIDILDKHINKGFTDGTYDAGLAAMNTRQEGVRIL